MTYADALACITEGMLHVHEQTCEIEHPHNWSRCTATPTVYAVADALDVLGPAQDLSAALLPQVERALHDRECDLLDCQWGATRPAAEHSRSGWGEQAAALLVFASQRRETPAPEVASVRGDLLARCACGHIRRGHSVDGLRCFATPCTCQADGGFRKKSA